MEIETRRWSEGSVISAGGGENGLRPFRALRLDLSAVLGFTWDDGDFADALSLSGIWETEDEEDPSDGTCATVG